MGQFLTIYGTPAPEPLSASSFQILTLTHYVETRTVALMSEPRSAESQRLLGHVAHSKLPISLLRSAVLFECHVPSPIHGIRLGPLASLSTWQTVGL